MNQMQMMSTYYPIVASKAMIDLVQGIDINRDHIHQQRKPQKVIDRIWDICTGENGRRQSEINQNLNEGLSVAIDLIQKLATLQSHSFYAISRVQKRLAEMNEVITIAGNLAEDAHNKLHQLQVNLQACLEKIDLRIQNLEINKECQLQMNTVFSRWEAGYLSPIPVAARCFVALQELSWGHCGELWRSQNSSRQEIWLTLCNKSVALLKQDMGAQDPNERFPLHHWITQEEVSPVHAELLSYLGEGDTVETFPFRTVVSQYHHGEENLPDMIPRRLSAHRLATALMHEFFPKEEN